MSAKNGRESSWTKRKSLFTSRLPAHLPSLAVPRDDAASAGESSISTKKKKAKQHARAPSILLERTASADVVVSEDLTKSRSLSDQSSRSSLQRPSLNMKATKRPPSLLDSLKNSVRHSSEELASYGYVSAYAGAEPLSTTSSKAPSLIFDGAMDGSSPSKTVLLHGEVQTSAGMFRKKKEYLVLTEAHILRYKSQAKAAEMFNNIANTQPSGRSPTVGHVSMPSFGSQSDMQTVSDSSGDKDGRVPLRQVVAVHKLDDGKPYYAFEICYADEDSGSASAMTLQFNYPEERNIWLKRCRSAVRDARLLRDSTYISPANLENAARIVERDADYDPSNCCLFKVVQRHPATRSGSRASSDDLTKVASTVCILAIGFHKVHFIPLVKPNSRSSSPSLAPNQSQASHGILTLTTIRVSSVDDSFLLVVRQPLQKPITFHLASSASYEIATRLISAENFLRPECGHQLLRLGSAPAEIEEYLTPPAAPDAEEHSCFNRTLIAYCVAYGANPGNVQYMVNYNCEDAPKFELLSPADARRSEYGPLELLAIMRALRYNESFGGLSFANIPLDSLNGLHDNYGQEYVCSRTKRGTPIRLSAEELNRSSLLVQEIRALAATSKKLRRMDFSGCITTSHAALPAPAEKERSRPKDIGCGIVEALFPLCKHQTTNVDWVCLNGIDLSETDLDYLVGAVVDKSCHFRAIELNRCGLTDRSLGLILDSLRAQENTLESLEIAGNGARLNPGTFDSQLAMFGFIRKLNLSDVSRTSSSEPFLQVDTLTIWRLQELRLSGTTLNPATIDAISTYLAHPQSSSLRELYLDNTHLSGADIATILYSLALDQDGARNMHLDISQCFMTKGQELVTQAIAKGQTPSRLSMRAIEYREEVQFRRVVSALTVNKSIQFLDMSQTALPGDASEDTCRSLGKMLAENDTLVELDISGDESRLATSKFGAGINEALLGLKENKSLQVLRVEKQKLGFRGASTLAEVLRTNSTLRELHCDHNEIPLHGLTDLVNSIIENTTLVYLPNMDDGRAAAFKSAESTMKTMTDFDSSGSPRSSRGPSFTATSAMKKGFANVRRTAQRSSSVRAPSFPALPSIGRSSPSPSRLSESSTSRHSSPLALATTALPSLATAASSPPPSTKPRHGHSGSFSFTTPPPPSSPTLTLQDIQTTHRLLSEQWDRQCYRLEQYLSRNWSLLQGISCNMEIEDEKFERPGSVGSIAKMLEQVRYDTTPRADRSQYFDSSASANLSSTSSSSLTALPPPSSTAQEERTSELLLPLPAAATTTSSLPLPSVSASITPSPPPPPSTEKHPRKHPVSFKHFILESTPANTASSTTTAAAAAAASQSAAVSCDDLDSSLDSFDEPHTPTQKAFDITT